MEKKLWLPGDDRHGHNGELSHDARTAISRSFQRHLEELGQAISTFEFLGTRVLSPLSNYIVEADNQFVFLDSDEGRSIKGVQNRHLAAISRADLLYVICPDGYTGQSVCFEIGFAVARGIPVLASAAPRDDTIKRYVDRVATPAQALNWLEGQKASPAADGGGGVDTVGTRGNDCRPPRPARRCRQGTDVEIFPERIRAGRAGSRDRRLSA